MGWADGIEEYEAHLRARGRAARTRHQARKILEAWARFCADRELGQVQLEDLLAYRQALREGRSEWTVADILARIRHFFRWAHRRGHLLIDPATELELGKLPRRLGRVLTPRQVERLLELPDSSTCLGLRDRAVLETFYGTGVRLEECHRLDLGDLDLAEGTLEVREGKGGRPRRLPLGQHLLGMLRDYLEHGRPALDPAPGEPALFLSYQGIRLGYGALGVLVREYGQRAGLAPLSPHRLRHAYATHLLEGGAELRHIQVLLGHQTVLATEIYTRIRPVELFRTIRRCHPRGRRKSSGPQLPAAPAVFRRGPARR